MTRPSVASIPLAMCLLLPLSIYAGTGQGDPQSAQEQVVEAEVAWEGEVTALDPAQRLITLRGGDGQVRTLRVDDEVQRLDRIRVGDRVEAYYRRSLVFDMQPAGSAEPGAYIWQDAQHPDPEMPGVIDRELVVVLAPLLAVDLEANTISIRSPNGSTQVLEVEQPRHRAALPGLQTGDLLRIQFRKLLAVRVTPTQ